MVGDDVVAEGDDAVGDVDDGGVIVELPVDGGVVVAGGEAGVAGFVVVDFAAGSAVFGVVVVEDCAKAAVVAARVSASERGANLVMIVSKMN